MHPGASLLAALSTDPLALTAGLAHRLVAAALAALAVWAVAGWAW